MARIMETNIVRCKRGEGRGRGADWGAQTGERVMAERAGFSVAISEARSASTKLAKVSPSVHADNPETSVVDLSFHSRYNESWVIL